MSELKPPQRIGRSIGALIAGFLANIILSLGTDIALHAIGVAPPLGERMSDALLLLATVYRTLYGVAGSYITARLAPNRPMQHVLLGCGVGLVLSIVVGAATWNRVPSLGPHWYSLALIATALPSAWVGGRLRVMQLREQAAN
jgi:hypothetical protein